MQSASRWPIWVSLAVPLIACGDNITVDPDAAPVTPDAPPALRCEEDRLPELLGMVPNVTAVHPSECGPGVYGPARCFELEISQPIDHRVPAGKQLTQHAFLTHRGCGNPTMIADWGYATQNFFDDELSILYRTNTLWLEHRYQGASTPSASEWDWRGLTIKNGAGDMHRVIEAFRPFYPDRWVSTGASKGGITAAYHAYLYPTDLDGTVPYVAPASRARIDAQYQAHLASTLPSPCAPAVRTVQTSALTSRRAAMIDHLTELGAAGFEETYLELLIGYLDWGYWQAAGLESCSQVPAASATDDQVWNFIYEYSGLAGFAQPAGSTEELSNGALSYEWLTEHGFALQIGEHVRPMLVDPYATATMEESFVAQFPDTELPAYDGSLTTAMRTWVRDSAENVLLIYGEFDPWSGAMLDEPTHPSSGRFIVPGANHGARIMALPPAQRVAALTITSRMFDRDPDFDESATRRAVAHRTALFDRQLRTHVVTTALRRVR